MHADATIARQLLGRRLNSFLARATLVLAGSAIIALAAQIAVPLPFTPVPITLQTFAVLLVGAALGSRLGVAAVLAYLAEGAAGLPVFANASLGIHHLVGPTGGYLFGFLPAAWIAGHLAELRWDRDARCILAMMLATAVIFAAGLAWLALIVPVNSLLAVGLFPFIPGALVKAAAAAAALPCARRIVERFTT